MIKPTGLLIFVLLIAAAMVIPSHAAGLRRKISKASGDKTVLCRITIIDTMYADDEGNIQAKQTPGCIPIFNDVESEILVSVDLPPHLRHQYSQKIGKGNLFMVISGATLGDERLKVTDQTTFRVLDQVPDHLERRLELTTTGALTVMIVRLSTRDGVSPVHSLEKMRSRLFGYGAGMRTQYRDCSFGQLIFDDAGGLEVTLPKSLSQYSNNGEIMKDAESVIIDTTGKRPHELADKVMFCFPPGTGGWIAFAGVDHWRSTFNNEWCLSLSANMHEIGHNLGLYHSGVGDSNYEDETGYMGYGGLSHDGPQKCFNGYKNHQLGWYRTREIVVDPSTTNRVELAAFVDFDKTNEDQPVLLNIDNRYFLQFNRAKLFNVGTTEKIDAVTVTENDPSFSKSVAGLYVDDEWTVDNYEGTGQSLVVKVCQRIDADDSKNNVDSMIVSIGLDANYCGIPRTEYDQMTTSPPSPVPSNEPTKTPTEEPTISPTREPTPAPTREDTSAPTDLGQCTCIEDGSVHYF